METKKLFIKLLLTAAIWAVVLYIGIAFVSAELNPFKWSEGSRVLLLIFDLIFTIAVIISPSDEF